MDSFADPHRPHCAATTRDGASCLASPLAGSPFCAFHDPSHAQAIAAGRSRGGAAPRRRTRRLPRRLDYLQVAELLGELFVDALNHANPADPRSLRAVCQVGRLLLHAVGRPRDSFVPPTDAAEPEADAPHLLRVYPASALALEGLFAAEDQGQRPVRPGYAAPAYGAASGFGEYRDYYFQPDYPAAAGDVQHAAPLAAGAADLAQEVAREETEEDAPAATRGPDCAPAVAALTDPTPALDPRPDPGLTAPLAGVPEGQPPLSRGS